jgi:hypothetical protein
MNAYGAGGKETFRELALNNPAKFFTGGGNAIGVLIIRAPPRCPPNIN